MLIAGAFGRVLNFGQQRLREDVGPSSRARRRKKNNGKGEEEDEGVAKEI